MASERRRVTCSLIQTPCDKRERHEGKCDTADSRALRGLARFMERHFQCANFVMLNRDNITCIGSECPHQRKNGLPFWALPRAYRRRPGR